jgi:rhodanese-related sulfurtransferase
MSSDTRKIFAEAGRIILLATALGLAYNTISPNGISLVRTPQQVTWANDSTTNPAYNAQALAIDINQAAQLLREGKAVFIDARHEEEYVQGHIPGALCIPVEELKRNPGLIASVPKDVPIVTYCSGEECELSTDLGYKIAAMGYTSVRIFFAGWLEWKQHGMPIELGPPGRPQP